ncbi:MAG: zinc ribbon domain-containing protein [Deltaproteobacteria bacterium]|nr:zinc ribbon domain-containing protein [Deltaproteobacteria bacterium]MBW1962706.1 zinc ribbon domain-containing protein [Deltaproteobacteria bacterium]MBW2151855.1 zinc ribbon domain-containing protein [Deltaproteobacteria bacterium]
MFLIAGISPKIKTVDNTPRRCPSCGLTRAYLKRIDHYFTLFFVPIFPVKKGEPVLVCDRCQEQGFEYRGVEEPWQPKEVQMCSQCGRTLDKSFLYCPYCGKRQ